MGYQLLRRPAPAGPASPLLSPQSALVRKRLLVGLPHALPAEGSSAASLLAAVLRGAGLAPGHVDVRQSLTLGQELDLDLPPLAQLAASPAARRALWPALRALRRRLRGAAPP